MKWFKGFCRIVFCCEVVVFLIFAACSSCDGALPDKDVLVALKKSISDPGGILSSWNLSSSDDYCSWHGISCDSKFRVISVSIIGGGGGERGNDNSYSPNCAGHTRFGYRRFGIRRGCSHGKERLSGKLSPLIGKLSELRVLSLPFNEFSGEIPVSIWGLKNLRVLDLEGNLFEGELPYRFEGLRKLRVLNLRFNKLVGEIPFSLSECVSLRVVDLARNHMSGSILDTVGRSAINCVNLEHLDVSANYLKGEIPKSLGKCRRLRMLLLFSNNFTGVIPRDLGCLSKLEVLDLSRNSLTGVLPNSLGTLSSLKVLILSSNSLFGHIPQSLVHLRNLEVLQLSNNNLSGEIPPGFDKIVSLSTFNISFNSLYYSSLEFDPVNCHDVRGNVFPHCRHAFFLLENVSDSPNTTVPPSGDDTPEKNRFNSIEIASIVSASAIVSVLLALIVLFFYTRKWLPNSRVQVAVSREITLFTDIGVPLTFDNVIQATGLFNASNCIGHGGFGATYRAEVSPGVVVAVKRLSAGRFQGVEQFRAEIKTLERVRHPNLVTLIGYHASEAEMFLIYNYLPGGNLAKFIEERSPKAVDWKVIHKIALDVAHALAYLHDQSVQRILHRDVKPSNILLDNNLNAYLSDFGLSRLMETSATHATTGVAGTFGYVAPEYAMTCRVSDKADVYSYGVVLLELLSDKKALDPSFSGHDNGFNIVSWAHLLLREGKAKDVFNQQLWDSGPHDKLVDALHLAVRCTVETLSIRPTMKQVVQKLKQLRSSYASLETGM